MRLPDGTWPAQPEVLGAHAALTLPSIAFAVPLAAFYRTRALAIG